MFYYNINVIQIIGVLFVFNKKLYNKHKPYMNLKRTFGAILTVLGIIGLIYTGVGIINHSGSYTTLTVVGIIGIIFFFTGISLVRTTNDETK
jgi:uncharacterized membrane protein